MEAVYYSDKLNDFYILQSTEKGFNVYHSNYTNIPVEITNDRLYLSDDLKLTLIKNDYILLGYL